MSSITVLQCLIQLFTRSLLETLKEAKKNLITGNSHISTGSGGLMLNTCNDYPSLVCINVEELVAKLFAS